MSSQPDVIPEIEDKKNSKEKYKKWKSSSKKLLQCRLQVRRAEFILYKEVCNSELSAMDWINCNTCCRQPGDEKERKFVLSNCGHLFCDICLMQADSQEICTICKMKCQFMQLSSKMKPDAELFFIEPGELLKRQFNQINRLLDFQKEHRTRLVSFHRRVLQKYKDLQKQHAAVTGRMQEIEKKYSTSSNRIQELEAEIHKLRNIINNQVTLGGSDAYAGRNPQKSPRTQRPSPNDGTRISPGRLTLVKTGQGVRSSQSPTNLSVSQSAPGINGTPVQPVISGNLIHTTQGTYFSPTQVQTHSGYVSQQHTPGMPGAGYYRSHSSAPSPSPSPTRGVANSVGRMTLMPYGQQLPEVKHYQYPTYVSPTYQGSRSDLRSGQRSSLDSPSNKMQTIRHPNSYNKFV